MAPFKSSIGRNLGKLLKGYRTSTLGYGLNATSTEEFSATGGSVNEPGNGYKYHTFTSPGEFVVASGEKFIEFLLVAGGGGGGRGLGGGGAGGLVYGPSYPISTGTHPVSVGSGGKGKTAAAPQPAVAGGNTVFIISASAITALGGGDANNATGSPGGSGGGGAGGGNGGPATQPAQPTFGGLVLNYGNSGGNAPGVNDGAGGGGAGAAGTPGNGGPGGAGRQYPQFTGPLIGLPALNPLNGYFAGGGGGCWRDGSPGGSGGAGGGGNGTTGYPVPGGNAVQYSGGGGGGGGTQSGQGNSDGGNGGDGICVVRYQI